MLYLFLRQIKFYLKHLVNWHMHMQMHMQLNVRSCAFYIYQIAQNVLLNDMHACKMVVEQVGHHIWT